MEEKSDTNENPASTQRSKNSIRREKRMKAQISTSQIQEIRPKIYNPEGDENMRLNQDTYIKKYNKLYFKFNRCKYDNIKYKKSDINFHSIYTKIKEEMHIIGYVTLVDRVSDVLNSPADEFLASFIKDFFTGYLPIHIYETQIDEINKICNITIKPPLIDFANNIMLFYITRDNLYYIYQYWIATTKFPLDEKPNIIKKNLFHKCFTLYGKYMPGFQSCSHKHKDIMYEYYILPLYGIAENYILDMMRVEK
jgi:hypothetical protein